MVLLGLITNKNNRAYMEIIISNLEKNPVTKMLFNMNIVKKDKDFYLFEVNPLLNFLFYISIPSLLISIVLYLFIENTILKILFYISLITGLIFLSISLFYLSTPYKWFIKFACKNKGYEPFIILNTEQTLRKVLEWDKLK